MHVVSLSHLSYSCSRIPRTRKITANRVSGEGGLLNETAQAIPTNWLPVGLTSTCCLVMTTRKSNLRTNTAFKTQPC